MTGRPGLLPGRRDDAPCPCCSGARLGVCCGPLLDGAPAATAEALMRSRFTAYVLGELDHVVRTWHPRTRPDDLDVTPGLEWVALEVLATEAGGPEDDRGEVEFRARYRHHREADGPAGQVLHERSRFTRRAGRWVYVDGDLR